MKFRRGLVFFLSESLPTAVSSLLADFRLLTNESIREASASGLTARGSLSRFALARARTAGVNSLYSLEASRLALALLKGHRRRLRRGSPSRLPYVRTPHLRATAQCFHLDVATGKLRLSLRFGEWTSILLPMSAYHRARLMETGVSVQQVLLLPHKAVLILARAVPEPYRATALYAWDTNESSLDGVRVRPAPVLASIPVHAPGTACLPLRPAPLPSELAKSSIPSEARLVRLRFPQIRTIQGRHFVRARRLAKKKAHDARVRRRLLSREGRRQGNRIRTRLHVLSRDLVDRAFRERAAIALEDLTGMPIRSRVRRSTRRRLSAWPRRELHRQIAYKAEAMGVPVYWCNPFRTSTTCPRCGAFQKHRSRVGPRFDCEDCGWSMDRQFNAGVNIGRTVLREYSRELGGLRLSPDALLEDAMRPLYLARRTRRARVERRSREGSSNSAGPSRAC